MDNSIQKTVLYRYFDSEGRLLYLGITGDNTKRQSQHRRDSFWFGLIASATFEHYPTRLEALAAEKSAIQSEQPKFNTQHLHSKKPDFNPIQMFAKLHLLTLMSGFDLNKKPVEIDQNHLNFKAEIDKFDTESEIYSLDECLVMELEHLVWREVQGEVQLPNLESCELCKTVFSSDWFESTLIEIDQRYDKAKMEKQNAAY